MSVQWFPGHMHATKKAMLERLKVEVILNSSSSLLTSRARPESADTALCMMP